MRRWALRCFWLRELGFLGMGLTSFCPLPRAQRPHRLHVLAARRGTDTLARTTRFIPAPAGRPRADTRPVQERRQGSGAPKTSPSDGFTVTHEVSH